MMSDEVEAKARSLAFIPVILLILIASVQIYLARTANLTPWKGGGFGMFSTTDGLANRSLRVFVTGPQRSEEILLQGNLEDLGMRVQLFPGNSQFEKLAKEILIDQQMKKLPIDNVKIEVWRVDYAKNSLRATPHLIRSYTYPGKHP